MSTAQLRLPAFAADSPAPDWKEKSDSGLAPEAGAIPAPVPDSHAAPQLGAIRPQMPQGDSVEPVAPPPGKAPAAPVAAEAEDADAAADAAGDAPEDLITEAGVEQPYADAEGGLLREVAGASFRRLGEAPGFGGLSAAGVLGGTSLAYGAVEAPAPRQVEVKDLIKAPANEVNRPFVFVSDVDAFEGPVGGSPGKIVFIVALSEAPLAPVTVSYRTEDVDAVGGQDYQSMSGTITFQPGQSAVFIEVPVLDDVLVEDTELMRLVLFNPIGAAVSDADGFATITDDDSIPATPEIAISDVDGFEDPSGTPVMRFIVSLSETTSVPVTVDFATRDIDAVAGEDYVPVSGTLTFAPGESFAIIEVPVLNDSIPEGTELFQVVLSNPIGGLIIDGEGFGSIDDGGVVASSSDAAPQVLTLSGEEAAETARAVAFDVTLSAPALETVTIEFATMDQQAIGGVDYAPISGTITFLPGQTRATLAVEVYSDRVFELDDAFSVELGAARGGSIAVGEVGFGLGRVAAGESGLAHFAPERSFDLSQISELVPADRGDTDTAGYILPDMGFAAAMAEPRIALSLASRARAEGVGTAGEESLTTGPLIDHHAPIQMQHALAATIAAERQLLGPAANAPHHTSAAAMDAADIIETGDIPWLSRDLDDGSAAYAGHHDGPSLAALVPALPEPELPQIATDY
jgi:hypothetical protein